MCESPTNNSLASWDSGMWSKERKKKKRESCSTLCQESFSVFAKNWAHSSGLSLCRLAAASQTEVYTHRCLQIWLPPAASDWIQSWDSAPQNTTRKHKMASCKSAILGLLKNTIRSTFQIFFFFYRACCLMMKKEQLFYQEWWRINLVPSSETKPTVLDDTLYHGYWMRGETWTLLIRQLDSSQRKSMITHSMYLSLWFINSSLTSRIIYFPLKVAAYPGTIAKLWIKVMRGRRVHMAATEGLMSARLNARPGPHRDREGVRRCTACIN